MLQSAVLAFSHVRNSNAVGKTINPQTMQFNRELQVAWEPPVGHCFGQDESASGNIWGPCLQSLEMGKQSSLQIQTQTPIVRLTWVQAPFHHLAV